MMATNMELPAKRECESVYEHGGTDSGKEEEVSKKAKMEEAGADDEIMSDSFAEEELRSKCLVREYQLFLVSTRARLLPSLLYSLLNYYSGNFEVDRDFDQWGKFPLGNWRNPIQLFIYVASKNVTKINGSIIGRIIDEIKRIEEEMVK